MCFAFWKRRALPEKTRHATGRDSNQVGLTRWLFRAEQHQLNARDMLFPDETGVHLPMISAYGRAPCGARLSADAPINRGQNSTVVAATGQERIVAPMGFTGSLTSEVFTQYLREQLLPDRGPASVLVMDNYSVHNTAAVQKALADVDVQPPYCPEYNPIELAWSKIKTQMRKAMARQFESLVEELGQAMRTVKNSDIEHWGYVFNPWRTCYKYRKPKLFPMLHRVRHELFDEGFQREFFTTYPHVSRGATMVPPAMLAIVTLLQAAHASSDGNSGRCGRQPLADSVGHAGKP